MMKEAKKFKAGLSRIWRIEPESIEGFIFGSIFTVGIVPMIYCTVNIIKTLRIASRILSGKDEHRDYVKRVHRFEIVEGTYKLGREDYYLHHGREWATPNVTACRREFE